MIYQLLALTSILFTCYAQEREHLTCLRTDDVLTSSPPPTPTRIQQGIPGKRGPSGSIGSPGSDGLKGSKGEPGIPDNSQIDELRENMTAMLRRGYLELDDGWVTPFNGYQYKSSSSRQTWDESRIVCQNWGGDLASIGIRDIGIRIILTRALSLSGRIWIGLSDKTTEGTWLWLNGNRASTDDVTLWISGQPDATTDQNCGAVDFYPEQTEGFLIRDLACTNSYPALCEKDANVN